MCLAQLRLVRCTIVRGNKRKAKVDAVDGQHRKASLTFSLLLSRLCWAVILSKTSDILFLVT